MNIKTNDKAERLLLFQSLYEQAKNSAQEEMTLLERHMRQYRGSDEIDGSHERATTVRNVTYELIESQVSPSIPSPKVDPSSYSERRVRMAKAIEELCATVRDRLPFEELNDLDERYTYVYGASVWFVEWDHTDRTAGEVGGVRVRCLSPRQLIPQPGVASLSDMDYCFLRFTVPKSELPRTYGISEEEAGRCQVEADCDLTVQDGSCATVIACFYHDERGEVGAFIFSGDVTLTDLPSYYRRKRRVCRRCGEDERDCRCGKGPSLVLSDDSDERLYRALSVTNGIPTHRYLHDPSELGEGEVLLDREPLRVPYYTPRAFPIVVRRNTSGEGQLFGQSDCAFIRPQQQAINKLESRILQKLLRAGVTPVVPEDASVSLNNAVFGQVIKMKPGESVAQYGTVDTTPDVSQDIAEAERLYLHAKRILGISDAYQGIGDTYGESGYARQLQINQATGRLESKRTMKHAAYAALDRLLFSFHLAYADEPRRVSYRDAYGRVHNAYFNRYDFLVPDGDGGLRYDDAFLFSVDRNGETEGQRSSLWQRNLDNLRSGALGDPSDAVTLLRYWQSQERAHYPFARENVEYFRDALEQTTGGETDDDA